MVTVRNGLSGLIVLALLVVWAPEIEEFALSIAAVAVALVIATKELILCISGAIWERTTRAFVIGDWVEIGGHSGEVIDETLFVTQLQEIEPREYRYTGRTIAVPNSTLLTQPVINHNFRKRFLEHEFTLHAPPDAPASAIRHAIEAALNAEFAQFETVARRYAGVIEKRAGVRLPDVAPTVRIETNVYGNLGFRCALFCPRDRAADLEQVAAEAMLAARTRQAAPVRAAEAAEAAAAE
jgi:small-conductance mechanosensitive channel